MLEDRRTRRVETTASAEQQRTIGQLQAQLQNKDAVIAFVSEEHLALKKRTWRELRARWVPPDLLDEVVDFVKALTKRTALPGWRILCKLAIPPQQYFRWDQGYGSLNRHNGKIPRDHWLDPWEREAILSYPASHPLAGYRRLSFMMAIADVVAVSPATVYRVLKQAGILDRHRGKPSKKSTGFQQPLTAHEHWHVDITYINIASTFYYLCALLDGYLSTAERGPARSTSCICRRTPP